MGENMKQLDLFGFENEITDVSELQKTRLSTYDKSHCFQYDIRLRNLQEDLFYCGLEKSEVESLKVSDFTFSLASNENEKDACVAFIKRHEWLGSVAPYTTHYFCAKYKDILSGVILMSIPNAFSKVLGDDTSELERLISRGACISWSPKNLASNFLMWCIKWMVDNTQYRVFSAYSDPTAKELGSIYQACNFYYLGQKFGSTTRYLNPYTNKICSDRYFRQNFAYKRYALNLGIKWDENWIVNNRIDWDKVPDDIESRLRAESKRVQNSSKVIEYPKKHKYIYVLGRDKRETKQLRNKFLQYNKVYPYPKERGL